VTGSWRKHGYAVNCGERGNRSPIHACVNRQYYAQGLGKAADWTDVPDDQGYAPMRNAIVRHVTALLDDLQKRRK